MTWAKRPRRGGLLRLGPRRPGDGSSALDEAALESRLVWIFGSPRSGSTWLLELLSHPLSPDGESDVAVARVDEPKAGTPRVIPINEPYISQHVSPILGENAIITLHSYRRTVASYFLSDRYADAWRSPLRALVLARLAAEADAISERYSLSNPLLIIKEPNGSLGADLVMSLFPRARLVFLLRDGRDVIDSMLDAQAPGAWLGALRPTSDTEPADRMAIIHRESWLWVARTEAVQRAYDMHAPELRRIVTYEDMRHDASAALTSLDAWLALGRGPEWTSSAIRWNDFESYPPEVKGPGKPLRAASPGLWRANLTAAEQSLMHEIMGAKLTELGYGSGASAAADDPSVPAR